MKRSLLICFIIFSFSVKGQSPVAKPFVFDSSTFNNSTLNHIVDYKKYFKEASFYDLQIYNPSVGLLENYSFISENQYDRKDKGALIYRSKYLLYFNSNVVLTPFTSRHIDSFNPYGVSNIGDAITLGVINTIFKKN